MGSFVIQLLSRCKIAVYCENRHRREDKERHDKLCNLPPENLPSKVVLEPSQLALGRSQMKEEVPFKLVEIEGKGRGLVATRSLEIGQLVLSEKAFLKVPHRFYKSFFSRLKPDIQAKLMNLFCPVDTGQDEILLMIKKFNANAIALDGFSVVFEMMSMINHSCMPNVAWFSEEDDETQMEVRVCRRIHE